MSEPAKPPQHPEGLPFQPIGPGFTLPDDVKNSGPVRRFLLSDHNIVSVQRNRPTEFESALFALKQVATVQERDPRTGLIKRGFTEEELKRLAALSVFVTVGVVS